MVITVSLLPSFVALESYKSLSGGAKTSEDQWSIMAAMLFGFFLFLPRNYTKNGDNYYLRGLQHVKFCIRNYLIQLAFL